jgi:hypothetical protein
MDFIGIIYMWVCLITGKGYVGLSRSSANEETRKHINTHEKLLHNRWKGHIQQSNYNPKDYFHFAIRKYGPDNFQGIILKEFTAESIEDIKKLIDDAEQKFIEEKNTLVPNGYNLQKGGFSPCFHPETCAKMRRKKQAFLNTDEGREWIQKCSDSQLLYFKTEMGLEQAKKHSETIKVLYENNPEIKTNISNSLLLYFDTPEGKIQIEKQKQYLKELFMTEDGEKLRNTLSVYAKKRWEHIEYRANQIKKGKERFIGEEGVYRKENLKNKAVERMKDPEKRKLASEKTKAHFDKVGRKEYICINCNKKCRDKTAYDRHCSTKIHNQIVLGLSKQEAKNKVQKNTSEKISKSNKLWAEKNINPRKGKTHKPESNEKNRLAHLGKTLSESARTKLSETIKKQYEKGERKSGLAKLTDEQVIYIRQNKGIIKQKELSEKLNISTQTISAVQNNLVYKHVNGAV